MTSSRRDAWLEIDLDAIRHNVGTIRSLLDPGVAVAPVVKANAYGHGAVAAAAVLAPVSDALCVATLDEALALRSAGILGRIVLLYPVPAAGITEALAADLELTVMSATDLRHLCEL
ncbi:MAG: alanine racemase, partial [Chloroflexota bacterium]